MLQSFLDKLNPQVFIILGGILTLIGAFLANRQTEKADKEMSISLKRNQEIAQTNVEISKENRSLALANSEIGAVNLKMAEGNQNLIDRNLKLTESVSSQAKEIENFITGSETFCTLHLTPSFATQNNGKIVFVVHGKYPLSSVEARLFDQNKTLQEQTSTQQQIFNSTITIGAVHPNKAIMTSNEFYMDIKKGVNLTVFFEANNGRYTQHLKMRFVDGEWTSALKVRRKDKIIFEEVKGKFPKSVLNNFDN